MGRILFEALVWTWMLGGSDADRSIENWSQSQSPGQDQSGDTEKNGRHCVWETCDALSYVVITCINVTKFIIIRLIVKYHSS